MDAKVYARFWKRAGAFALDYIIVLGYLFALSLCSFLANLSFGTNEWLFAGRTGAQIAGFLLITLPVSLYFALSESSAHQATWENGK